MTTIESRIEALLDEGKDAGMCIMILDDEEIFSKELVRRLIEAGADVNEVVRVTRWEVCSELAAIFLQAGVDVDGLVKKIGEHLCYHYDDKISEMVVATVRLAADFGVKASTIMRLMEEAPAYAQDVFQQIDYLYEHGCKIDIDQCLDDGLVTLGKLGEDIAKVVDVGYPLEKIVDQCVKKQALDPSTVATLAARGANISEIADAHPELVVKYPKQFGGVKNPEALYTHLRPDSDFDALIGEFGMEPSRIVQEISTHRVAGIWEVNDILEPLLRNGLKPREFAKLALIQNATTLVVMNFRLLKQYDPEFDLEPGIEYDIPRDSFLEELLSCGANRKVVVDSAIRHISRHYLGDGVLSTKKMLKLATADEARRLLTELPEAAVAWTLKYFIDCDKLEPEDIALALKKANDSGWHIAGEIHDALPTLYARGVPLERDVLERVARGIYRLSEKDFECLVKYGLRPSELMDRMGLDMLKANIELLVEDGYNPDKLAMMLAREGVDLSGEIRERLKKAGAKFWV